jgi:hypothetical protein
MCITQSLLKFRIASNIATAFDEKTMKVSPFAGKPAESSMLVNVPDPSVPAQRIAFGTSGHRGSSFDKAFNERHILAISQAICLYRNRLGINGPLFLGIDTHALSEPAFASAMEVLAANAIEVMIAENDEYTPTPVISHAILTYNKGRKTGLADGIVITMAVSNTTRLTAALPNPTLRTGLRQRQMSSLKRICWELKEFLLRRHLMLPRRIGIITSMTM